MAARFYRVILPVDEIALAEKFYSTLLDDPGSRVSPGRHYFDCAGMILACYDPEADGDGWRHHPNQYFYFAVDDLDGLFGRANWLGFRKIDASIKEMPWGERLFYGQDPFGNSVCFVDSKTLFTG